MAQCIRISEHSWRIEDGGVRFYLFCGEQRAALIDSGMNTPDAREIAGGLTDLPLVLINTHADPDHISGNGAFASFYMSPAEEENYRSHGGTGSLVPVREGDIIDLGGRTLRIIDIPGHTPGSIALLDERERVMICGDSVQDGNIYMFGRFRDMARYVESLKHLSGYDGLYDDIYPMHGSFPVKPDLVGRLIAGAQSILNGTAEGKPAVVSGREICHYRFPWAGFLCEPCDQAR